LHRIPNDRSLTVLEGKRLLNLVAAGPIETRAGRGIPGFDQLLDAWATTSPLEWNPNDPSPVADSVCFLLSDLARAITGEVLHVDGGYHAMSAPFATRLDGGAQS
jgi:meromycolic acid enoyl-[acyl-carrier-protein] reductase